MSVTLVSRFRFAWILLLWAVPGWAQTPTPQFVVQRNAAPTATGVPTDTPTIGPSKTPTPVPTPPSWFMDFLAATSTPTTGPSPTPTCPVECVVTGTIYHADGKVDANDVMTVYSAITRPISLLGCTINPMPPITTTTDANGVMIPIRVPQGLPVTVTLRNGGGAPVQTYVPYLSGVDVGQFLTQASVNRAVHLNDLAPPDAAVDMNGQAVTNMQSITFVPITCAGLPTEVDGVGYFCSDCQVTDPCTCGGLGALAIGIGGQWRCFE